MAYNENLAERIRGVLKRRRGVTEKKMFGGLTFLVNGNMCCGVVKNDLTLRLGKEGVTEVLDEPHVRDMDFTGKPIKSMIYISPAGTKKDDDLKEWIDLAFKFAKSLPPK